MNGRVDPDAATAAAAAGTMLGPATVVPQAIIPAGDPDERWGGNALPNDHPAWMRDTLSLSQRARALIAQVKPVVISVVKAWDHRVRTILVGNRRLSVDVSGSYRLE